MIGGLVVMVWVWAGHPNVCSAPMPADLAMAIRRSVPPGTVPIPIIIPAGSPDVEEFCGVAT